MAMEMPLATQLMRSLGREFGVRALPLPYLPTRGPRSSREEVVPLQHMQHEAQIVESPSSSLEDIIPNLTRTLPK
jgi:hypothetical protein